MTLPNPEHLLRQGDELSRPPLAGAPRQTDLRRAVSAAYYALFHAICTECADTIIGRIQRDAPSYALVYRSVSHAQLKALCGVLTSKNNISPRYSAYFSSREKLGPDISEVAEKLIQLQEERLSADYDPLLRLTRSDVHLALEASRIALEKWKAATPEYRRTFVLLLLFPPKDGRS